MTVREEVASIAMASLIDNNCIARIATSGKDGWVQVVFAWLLIDDTAVIALFLYIILNRCGIDKSLLQARLITVNEASLQSEHLRETCL